MGSWCLGVGGIEVGFVHWILVIQEMLGHWRQYVSYICIAGQQQENQLVHGRVSSRSLIL